MRTPSSLLHQHLHLRIPLRPNVGEGAGGKHALGLGAAGVAARGPFAVAVGIFYNVDLVGTGGQGGEFNAVAREGA